MSTTVAPTTATVTSADGTRIAYQKDGSGPPLIIVDGALCHRAFGPSPQLAEALRADYTVHTYDRRGRGESGDTAPYSTRREVEDIAALLDAAGGSAFLFGMSSGAALAMDAANELAGITRLALYEAPFIVDGTGKPRVRFTETLDELIARDDRAGAVKFFMKTVGAPSIMIALMSLTPPWRKLKAVAHTLPHDARLLDGTGAGAPLPTDRWATLTAPTLVMAGGRSPAFMRNAQQAIAALLPDTRHRTLPNQTHMVKAAALAPELKTFLTP